MREDLASARRKPVPTDQRTSKQGGLVHDVSNDIVDKFWWEAGRRHAELWAT